MWNKPYFYLTLINIKLKEKTWLFSVNLTKVVTSLQRLSDWIATFWLFLQLLFLSPFVWNFIIWQFFFAKLQLWRWHRFIDLPMKLSNKTQELLWWKNCRHASSLSCKHLQETDSSELTFHWLAKSVKPDFDIPSELSQKGYCFKLSYS